jgi:acyl-CoA dehydrogenase
LAVGAGILDLTASTVLLIAVRYGLLVVVAPIAALTLAFTVTRAVVSPVSTSYPAMRPGVSNGRRARDSGRLEPVTFDDARHDLEAWRAEFPDDPFGADAPLRRLLMGALPAERMAALEHDASRFGRAVVDTIGPASVRYEHRAHLPELARYDSIGRRIEAVRFDPDYHRAGAAVWQSGLVAHSGTPGRAYEQAVLLYLLSLEGEAGHACPAVCTIGLARALRRTADSAIRDRFLPPLLDTDYARAERGSQFLTEVQGGSDVGANATIARPGADGTYAITGEKWFCSVADAQQFLVTARVADGPAGTRGLGCFVIPRMIDGEPNGFVLRRLKEKLGTRGMASGEIDLDGARAWPIGPVENGFRTAAGIVLNTSRWMTAIGSAGMMRRAYLEASAYARHRRAFGRPIDEFPSTRATVADLRVMWLGALHLVFALTALEDRIDSSSADDEITVYHRFLVNATKYALSVDATAAARKAIEILGGNGTIEEFSVLPRLYRDSIVYESWEGTHNVLVAQVLTDLHRMPIVDIVAERIGEVLRTNATPVAAQAHAQLDDALRDMRHSITDTDFGARHFRTILDNVMTIARVAALLDGGEDVAAEHLLRTRLVSLNPLRDTGYAARVDALAAED